jgi:WhiB family transcriptional regulator, redox-sensing transcriptional regulator
MHPGTTVDAFKLGRKAVNKFPPGAACLGLTELFYPDEDHYLYDEKVQAAKAICATCPIKPECAERAIRLRESDGIWGGMTPRERRRVKRSWARDTMGMAEPERNVVPVITDARLAKALKGEW